jgi:hypothetical protein
MASGAQVKAKIAAKLALLNPTPRVVSFRQTTRTGGNPRLGIGGTVATSDTVADPQPAATQVSVEQIASSGGFIQPGDWEFTFAGTVEEDTLKTSQILFGDTEVLNIVRYDPYALSGLVVAWRVIGRTSRTQ